MAKLEKNPSMPVTSLPIPVSLCHLFAKVASETLTPSNNPLEDLKYAQVGSGNDKEVSE